MPNVLFVPAFGYQRAQRHCDNIKASDYSLTEGRRSVNAMSGNLIFRPRIHRQTRRWFRISRLHIIGQR